MGRPDRPGHRVVDVAAVGGFIAARPPTRQIPAPHKISQLPRRPILRLRWRIAGWRISRPWHGPKSRPTTTRASPHHRSQTPAAPRTTPMTTKRFRRWRGAEGTRRRGMLSDRRRFQRRLDVRLGHRRGDNRVRCHRRRRGGRRRFGTGGRHGCGLGDDVNHRGGRRGHITSCGGAVGAAALAGQWGEARGDRGQRVTAPLPSVRGSSAHTEPTICSTRCSTTTASGPYTRAHMVEYPASSLGDPNTTSRPHDASRERRNAPGSTSSTIASMACSSFLADNGPHARHAQPTTHRPARSPRRGDQPGAVLNRAHQHFADQPGLKQRRHRG